MDTHWFQYRPQKPDTVTPQGVTLGVTLGVTPGVTLGETPGVTLGETLGVTLGEMYGATYGWCNTTLGLSITWTLSLTYACFVAQTHHLSQDRQRKDADVNANGTVHMARFSTEEVIT